MNPFEIRENELLRPGGQTISLPTSPLMADFLIAFQESGISV